MQRKRAEMHRWSTTAKRLDVEGSQESASDVESREYPSPLRGRELYVGPPSTASEREEQTLRSWDASVSAASAVSDAEERRTVDEADYDGGYDAGDDAESTTAGSTTSGSREDWLQSLLNGMERYNPAHIVPLEELVQRQSDGEEPYCVDANLALLSLYQLNPRRFHAGNARLILLLAMGHLPLPDFVLCKCLLPGPLMEAPPLAGIVALAELLETCAFAEYWECVRAQPELVAGVRGLTTAVRDFVAHVVGSAYQRLSLKRLNALLGGMAEEEMNTWLSERDWKVEQIPNENGDIGEPMVFVTNQEQVVKNRRIVERVELDTIERLLARMTD